MHLGVEATTLRSPRLSGIWRYTDSLIDQGPSLGRAAKEFQVSDTTIKRLVTGGLLKVGQVAPWAPWEIRRADLEAEPIRRILDHLRRAGELVLPGDTSAAQPSLFQ